MPRGQGRSKPNPRQKHKSARERETFIFEIIEWDLPYSYSVNQSGHFPGSYSEYLHLEVRGVMRLPLKLEGKEIQATFIGSRTETAMLEGHAEARYEPKSVGHLTIRGENRNYIGSIPFDSIPIIISLLNMQQVKFIDFSGDALYRGSASIDCVRFFRDFDLSEWV